jgi:3-oxoacyl-[acyl-carrier protein] reductase
MASSARIALITGAGSAKGIGYATARALGSAGYRLILCGLGERVEERARELAATGVSARAFVGDLTEPTTVDRLYSMAGAVEVLVNNAGMAASGEIDEQVPVQLMSLAQWQRAIERNLTSAFLVTRACLPTMQTGGFGRIVNVSSTTGAVAGVAGDAAYAAAKAGLLGFTRSLALEVARVGITVNAVAPGWIATGSQTQAERAAGHATPLGRSGRADEVAAAIGFLVSDSASYVTGQMLIVDGGNSVMESRA